VLLKPYIERGELGEEWPTAELVDGEEWEVGVSLKNGMHTTERNMKGYTSYEKSWEPIPNLKNAKKSHYRQQESS
jgi:hypothetical protein